MPPNGAEPPVLPPGGILAARLVISLLLVGFAGFAMFGPSSLIDARGTEEFYASVAQVLAALLIAFYVHTP